MKAIESTISEELYSQSEDGQTQMNKQTNQIWLHTIVCGAYNSFRNSLQLKKKTRILRVLHIPAAKISGPKILEVSPCSD